MKRTSWFAAGLCLLGLAAGGVALATTFHTITVDGKLADFAADEKTKGDVAGDGWGVNNDLTTLYATWDKTNLYLGFDYAAWGTAVMYLVDTGLAGGVSNFCPNSGYKGSFPGNIQGQGFALMVAMWVDPAAKKPTPYVYALANSTSADITTKAGIKIAHSHTGDATKFINSGQVEVQIPWLQFYKTMGGKVPVGEKLRIVGVLRGSGSGPGLGDVSPNQTTAPSSSDCWSTSGNLLTRFHELTIDANRDGVPDTGWSPGPNKKAPQPDRGVVTPDIGRKDGTIPPDQTLVTPDQTLVTPDQTLVTPDQTLVKPDQTLVKDGAVRLQNGAACGAAGQCKSGFCVDGVCCNVACGNGATWDCEACAVAKGAATNGTCGPVKAATVCRPTKGPCDVADVCDGKARTCPADSYQPKTKICRAVTGVCDVQELCSGTAATCPADKFKGAGTVCNVAPGPCGNAPVCNGKAGACPTATYKASGTNCRPAANDCDQAETCNGKLFTCPADKKQADGTACNKGAGTCKAGQCMTKADAGVPDQKIVTPDQKVTTPDQKVTTPDQKIVTLDQKVTTPDQKVTTPDQGKKPPSVQEEGGCSVAGDAEPTRLWLLVLLGLIGVRRKN